MFSIGGLELVVIALVALFVIGPGELPRVLYFFGKWLGKIRRTMDDFQKYIEAQAGYEDAETLNKDLDRIKKMREEKNGEDGQK